MQVRQKNTLLIGLGSLFEYYDFIIYGMMMPYLGPLFFKSFSGENAEGWVITFYTLAAFCISYIVRPLGGFLFGFMADKKGRKKALLSLMLLMGTSTFLIGCLPAPQENALLPGLLLFFLRVCQGISFGAELPGAMTIMGELEKNKIQGKSSGFVISSTAIGAILASVVLFGLSSFYQKTEIEAFVWRVPFWLGGVLCFILYIMRRSLTESPFFLKPTSKKSIKTTLLSKGNMDSLFYGIGITLLPTLLVISNIMFPMFLSKQFAYELSEIYGAATLSLLWSAMVAILGGRAIDITGKEFFFKKISFAFIPIVVFILYLIATGEWIALLLAFLLYQTFLTLFATLLWPFLFSAFKVDVRAISMGTVYNVGYSLASLLATGLFFLGDFFDSLPLVPIGMGWVLINIFAFYSAHKIKNHH